MRTIAIMLVLGAATATAASLPARYTGLADAEREFAAAGVRDGVQKSFLAHFADDAIVFKPFATPGRDWYRSHPDSGVRLIWAPQFLAVSSAGDLGLSSGPWRVEAEKDGKPVRAHGHFFSIWRRNGDGKWQVVFDQGVGHDAPAVAVEATPLIGLPVDTHTRSADREARQAALAAADDALREKLRADAGAGYEALAREQTLWLRDGAVPAQSKTPPPPVPGACGCGPRVALGVAASGDVGYTIGGAAAERDRGADARVWRFDDEHGWVLLADLAVAAG